MAGVNTITVCSFNVNGMNDSFKRKDVLDYLQQRKYGIYLLQETHIKTESENYLCTAWGYNVWARP